MISVLQKLQLGLGEVGIVVGSEKMRDEAGKVDGPLVGWCVWQLLGKAPAELQVKAPKLAATFEIGGPICTSVCTVLRRPC